ncbi:ABC transporter ATP-binding protein [Sediminibacillus albus]|uniref:ABC-2 type transport system ATP-binding protein n=1 Tax=Sediminibacillus albus TaxID=407036 RepID=A0A1G8WYX7_9BACI|nr:ABC transporter ATP-binding protein [Sediminibacillus albus]SDJ83414.1 ABC-2 type transport system ATP-binding protein [Sediminibacillus albus]
MDGLKVEKVNIEIKNESILKDISFYLQPGTITALIGHNGAGKSTIMKTLIGLQEKTSGTISLNGDSQDDHFLSFKQKLAYIPEEPFLLPELTTMQHFQLYGKSYQIDERDLKEKVDYYIHELEIGDKLHEFPESLSKGMRQKVQTICALLPEVPLLLIDEPFMGLDVYAADFLQQQMAAKAEQGMAILLTSHLLDRLQDTADQYLMLQQGKVVDQGEMGSFHELKRRFAE